MCSSDLSLVVRFNKLTKYIEVHDVHHNVIMKHIACPDPLCFPIIEEAVRDGRITFDYLLSDEVKHIDDIEVDVTLKDMAYAANADIEEITNVHEVKQPEQIYIPQQEGENTRGSSYY